MEGYKSFLFFLVSSLLLGFALVIFVLVWVLHYSDGLAWDRDSAEFNWHPVLIITGFVFIEGIAFWSFRLQNAEINAAPPSRHRTDLNSAIANNRVQLVKSHGKSLWCEWDFILTVSWWVQTSIRTHLSSSLGQLLSKQVSPLEDFTSSPVMVTTI
ncbi:hypothetical protein AB205_0069930 [Aquarana catesbeiana]|uniref:Cytochrome b561 domain-containing protein n=1 Tax=Aquarana catesbeiana TaxID=8400 RepID=A0A2G9QCC3_AQUCT|nr:hypothetical protein AB205_0069930 [Aquarana catesbeiana]